MAENHDNDLKDAKVVETSEAYKESDDHVPAPTDMYGTLDTSGTAGTAHSRLEEVTPVFDVAAKQDAITAARALDPEDKEVPESLVILPEGQQLVQGDPEAARTRIQNKAAAAAKEPVVLGGETAAQEDASQSGDEAAKDAKADQARTEGSAGTVKSEGDAARTVEADAKQAKAASTKK